MGRGSVAGSLVESGSSDGFEVTLGEAPTGDADVEPVVAESVSGVLATGCSDVGAIESSSCALQANAMTATHGER